ncbi:MAG: MBL fold metallo-hydrolase [Sphingomonadales bacterium]|nr:MBL fold metallo-hydrolase [Sphingomonadales bacterium]
MIHGFEFGVFQENTYLVYDANGNTLIVDPGCQYPEEQQALKDYIEDQGLHPVRLLNTHCHIDHILGNDFVNRTYGLRPWIHRDDETDLNRLTAYAPVFGIQATASPPPEGYLSEGDEIHLGEITLKVREAPGHSLGSLVFINDAEEWVLGGDVLFQGSIGRTDLPGGEYNTLIASIHRCLMTLPDAYSVYSGHGPATRIGQERRYNPFINGVMKEG